jgi:hydrogenase nickel incorporation protein HypA/HybF
MHEVGIMESALAVIREQAAAHGAPRVSRVVLRIGQLSGVDVDALRFAFDAVSAGTPAAEAELEIVSVPARAHCAECDADFGASGGFILTCPRCRAFSSDIRAGRELDIARLEFPALP